MFLLARTLVRLVECCEEQPRFWVAVRHGHRSVAGHWNRRHTHRESSGQGLGHRSYYRLATLFDGTYVLHTHPSRHQSRVTGNASRPVMGVFSTAMVTGVGSHSSGGYTAMSMQHGVMVGERLGAGTGLYVFVGQSHEINCGNGTGWTNGFILALHLKPDEETEEEEKKRDSWSDSGSDMYLYPESGMAWCMSNSSISGPPPPTPLPGEEHLHVRLG